MTLSLLPSAEQAAVAPKPETVSLGPETENRQYQHILSVATSQESRLKKHAAVRRTPKGYDLNDPWLVIGTQDGGSRPHDSDKVKLVPGAPCLLKGRGEVVAFFELLTNPGTDCRVRLCNGQFKTICRQDLLPLPAQPARQGDWVFLIDLNGEQAHLNGKRGMCGLTGKILGPQPRRGFWVSFEPSDPTLPPELVLIDEANLVTLPTPPAGAHRTPWEQRHLDALIARQDVPALVDESSLEQQLALCYGDDDGQDEQSVAGSVDLSGSEDDNCNVGACRASSSSQGKQFCRGELVKVRLPAGTCIGIVERVTGKKASVRLLGCAEGNKEVCEVSEKVLTHISEEQLQLEATCQVCGQAEPEDQLLLCENYARSELMSKCCVGSAHIGCLTPPLKSLPAQEEKWFCNECKTGASSPVKTKPNVKASSKAQVSPKSSTKAVAKSNGRSVTKGIIKEKPKGKSNAKQT